MFRKVLIEMAQTTFDLADLKRRMAGAVQSFKGDLASLRSGRASANMLDPITVEAYGARTPLSQLATVSVPEPRLLSVQVWDRSMVQAVDKAVRESDLGLNPQTEGQVLRIRIPELNDLVALALQKVRQGIDRLAGALPPGFQPALHPVLQLLQAVKLFVGNYRLLNRHLFNPLQCRRLSVELLFQVGNATLQHGRVIRLGLLGRLPDRLPQLDQIHRLQ